MRTARGYALYAGRVLRQSGLPDRGRLYRRVAAHQVRLAAHDLATLRAYGLGGLVVVAMPLVVAATAAGPARLPAGAIVVATPPYRWAAIATTMGVLAAVSLIVLRSGSRRRAERAALARLAVATLAACGLLAVAAALHGPLLLVVVAASAAATLVPTVGLLLVLYVLVAGLYARRERAFAAAEPDAVATDAVLRLLDRSRSGWHRPATRAAMLADLERLAGAVDGGFARLMRSGDRSTDAWVRDRAARAGAAARQLKRWVATPLVDTRERFRERLAADLVILAEGRWDQLERTTGEADVPSRPPLWATVRSLAGSAVVALAPGAALWAYRRLDPSAASALPAWAAGGCVLWAVATLLLAVDPALADRTRAVRGVLDTLAGRGKT